MKKILIICLFLAVNIAGFANAEPVKRGLEENELALLDSLVFSDIDKSGVNSCDFEDPDLLDLEDIDLLTDIELDILNELF